MTALAFGLVGSIRAAALAATLAFLGGCATKPPYDYTAYKLSRPKSLLVLPPTSDAPDVKASGSVMATATMPLAEAGYYVMPVALVDETFKQNGMPDAASIQQISAAKLRGIFGADAAVYIHVKDYGTKYLIFGSESRVTVEGKIVDLRNGALIWQGRATASSQESDSGNQGGLVGLLVKAVVKQIVGTVTDESFNYGAIANQRMLGAGIKNGVLYGPRSSNYEKD